MNFRQKIRDYINMNLSILDDEAQFLDDDNIFKMGFVNSLFAMRLLAFIEKEFELKINDSDIGIDNFSSINNIANLIEKYKVVV